MKMNESSLTQSSRKSPDRSVRGVPSKVVVLKTNKGLSASLSNLSGNKTNLERLTFDLKIKKEIESLKEQIRQKTFEQS